MKLLIAIFILTLSQNTFGHITKKNIPQKCLYLADCLESKQTEFSTKSCSVTYKNIGIELKDPEFDPLITCNRIINTYKQSLNTINQKKKN